MEQELMPNEIYKLVSKNSNGTTNEYAVTIEKILGRGATSLVYEAFYIDEYEAKHTVILKECFPSYIHLQRGKGGQVIVLEENLEQFNAEKRDFIDTYKNNIMLQNLEGTVNSTVVAQTVLEGNNTVYILTNYHEGISYNKVQGESLKEILQTMCAVCKVIGKYHKQGFLYLDLKPANILKIPETDEMVLLFDFGSVVRKADILSGKVRNLSYSKEWAAPELESGRLRRIGEATDLYAIGAMLFQRVRGRNLTLDDLMDINSLDFHTAILETYPPKVKTYLKEIFVRTLNPSVGRRYQRAEELEKVLCAVLEFAREDYVYIKSNFVYDDQFFVGRAGEIKDIEEQLREKDVLFVHGFGGIGKSSIAKKYAKDFSHLYDTIVMINYTSNLQEAISSDYELPLTHFEKEKDEAIGDYYQRKLSKIAELADAHTLFIIDNFDTEEDEYLQDLLNCGGKVLITTRTDFSDYNYPQIDVNRFEDIEEIKAIFYKYNPTPYEIEEKVCIGNIIELIQRHTMTVELVAKLMRVSQIRPNELYEKLCEATGIANMGDEIVRQKKDRRLNRMSIMMHLKIIFNISALEERQKVILRNLSLLSTIKINQDLFFDWIGTNYVVELMNLIERGWVQYDERGHKICLHQIVTDLTYEEEKPTAHTCSNLTVQMSEIAKLEHCASYTERSQKLKLCHIFEKRINGATLPLEIFYKNLGATLINTDYKKADLCLQKAQAILSALDLINSHEAAQLLILEGSNRLKTNEELYFYGDCDLEEEVQKAIETFNHALKITQALCNPSEDLELAKQYIQIGKVIQRYDQFSLMGDGEAYEMLYEYCEELFKEAVQLAELAQSLEEDKIKEYKVICLEAANFFNPHDYTMFFSEKKDEELFLLYKQKAEKYNVVPSDCLYIDPYEVNNFTLGEVAASKGKYDQAIAYYEEALKENGNYLEDEVLRALINVYIAQGEILRAREYIDQLIMYDQEKEEISLAFSYHYFGEQFEKSDVKEAIYWYEKTLREVEKEVLAIKGKQDIQIDADDNDERIEINYGIIEKGILANLGLWRLSQKPVYLEEAINYHSQYFESCQESYYEFSDLFRTYAQVQSQKSDAKCQEEGTKYYLRAIQEYDKNYLIEEQISCAYEILETYEVITNKAQEVHQVLCDAYAVLGKQASDQFDYEKAYTLYGKAYTLAKKCYGKYYYKTVKILDAYIRQGEYSGILSDQQQSDLYKECHYEIVAEHELAQETEDYRYIQIWQYTGDQYYNIGNLSKALVCYKNAIKRATDYECIMLLENMKRCYEQQEDYDKVQEILVLLIKTKLSENEHKESNRIYEYNTIAQWYEELATAKAQQKDYELATYFYNGALHYYIVLGSIPEKNHQYKLLVQLARAILECRVPLIDINEIGQQPYYNVEDSIIEMLTKLGSFYGELGEIEQAELVLGKAEQIKNRDFEI